MLKVKINFYYYFHEGKEIKWIVKSQKTSFFYWKKEVRNQQIVLWIRNNRPKHDKNLESFENNLRSSWFTDSYFLRPKLVETLVESVIHNMEQSSVAFKTIRFYYCILIYIQEICYLIMASNFNSIIVIVIIII